MARGNRMGRLGFRLLALFAATALLGALATLGLAVALQRGWQRDRLRSGVEALADRELALHGLDARLRIGALEGPLYPSLVLRDVRLERSGDTVARADRLGLRMDASDLWRGRKLVLERVELEGVDLSLRRDPERGWPWAAWQSGSRPRALTLEIRSLRVSPARLALSFEEAGQPSRLAGPLELEVDGLVLPRAGEPTWPAQARARWQLLAGRVAGRALRGGDLALALEGSSLRVGPAVLDAEFGRARVEATADLAGWLEPGHPAALSLEGDAEGLDLGALLARPALAGAITGHVTARVERAANASLRDARAEIAATIGAQRLGALRVATAELRGSLADGRFELSRAIVDSSLGRLRASGRGSLERLDASSLDLELRDLGALAALAGHPGALAGQAQLVARGAGPWGALQGEASLHATQVRVGSTPLGTVAAGLRAERAGRLVLDPLRLAGGDWPVEAEGPVALRRVAAGVRVETARLRLFDEASLSLAGGIDLQAARKLRVELQGLPLARVASLGGSAGRFGGRLDATLALDGAWPRPAVHGALQWESPRLGEARADRIAARFASEGRQLQGEASLQARGRRLALARFSTPWDAGIEPARVLERPETRLSAEASDLDLALLGDFVSPAVRELRGRAHLVLELQGGRPEPLLSGELALADAGLALPALGQRLGPLDGRLTLSGDTLRVESLRLTDGAEGEALLTGRVGLVGLAPASAELELALHRFRFQYAGRLRADLDGGIELSGPPDALVARGELVLGKARYFLTDQPSPVVAEISVRNDPARPPGAEPGALFPRAPALYARSRVDVRIEIPPDARAVGQGADVRIRGLLFARKPPLRELALDGTVETLGGVYRIRGKSFEVKRGRVVFTGRPDFDPELELRASRRVRDLEVIARLGGRGSNPTIRLESDPPRPEDDLLALLLFGRTREELGRGESGAFQSFLAEAAGGAALEQLRTITGIPIPLDVFDVRAPSEGTGSTVGIGAHVTRDVVVHFGKGLGETAGSEVGLDWRFAPPHWSVETRSTTDRGSSADLVWTYDY